MALAAGLFRENRPPACVFPVSIAQPGRAHLETVPLELPARGQRACTTLTAGLAELEAALR